MASEALKNLSPDHCKLLAADYACEGQYEALHILLVLRQDAFTPELALRFILTYIAETVEPARYTPLVAKLAGLSPPDSDLPTVKIDASSVEHYSDEEAFELAQEEELEPLDHDAFPASLCDDLAARFLINRAHFIAEVGMWDYMVDLVEPFLDDRPFLKTWFISNVLPLLRFTYEYYPEEAGSCTLKELESANAEQAIQLLLLKSLDTTIENAASSAVVRDLKSLFGPWASGAHDRQRRKLYIGHEREQSLSEYSDNTLRYGNELEDTVDPKDQYTILLSQWERAFKWMINAASAHLATIVETIETWDGPTDVDLGGYQTNSYVDDDLKQRLKALYSQTAFACVYAADLATREATNCAHTILVRIAQLMDFEPPPDLATSVDMLPKVDDRKSMLLELSSQALQPQILLDEKHPLTHPATDTFALLQLFVFSSYVFLELEYPISVVATAKARFQYDAAEQLGVVTRILRKLAINPRRDQDDWSGIRCRLLWLWGWGFPKEEDGANVGHGIFGKIERHVIESEIMKTLLETGNFALVSEIYGPQSDTFTGLTKKDIESSIISAALHHYDKASNGNRTRGGVKKASDIIAAFKKHFPDSEAFNRIEALLAATHALSYYSLKIQPNVPFRPVNIRASPDPIALIEKLLAQNKKSYTKLDDLISIATNLAASGIAEEVLEGESPHYLTSTELEKAKRTAKHRAVGMAIEAALVEDDFETAYSYVINRLDTSSTFPADQTRELDDISWRAALAAGRHKSAFATSSSSHSTSTPPKLRRLEQRMDLLSQTLLLAPPNALPEVLNVWRKCEEEMISLQAAEAADEDAFNRRAEQGLPGAFVDATAPAQPRREVGRGAVEEAPMGLFDVARGAASAFSRTAFPLRGTEVRTSAQHPSSGDHARAVSAASSEASDDNIHRPRRRDMISNAASGALASGIGWVIGAKPADR